MGCPSKASKRASAPAHGADFSTKPEAENLVLLRSLKRQHCSSERPTRLHEVRLLYQPGLEESVHLLPAIARASVEPQALYQEGRGYFVLIKETEAQRSQVRC